MARLPRLDVIGVPQHVIQLGNNKQACFFASMDYRLYLRYLESAAKKYHCAIHAYVLMTNHVHLLATGHSKGALSSMMQNLGRRYVRYINTAYQRTGTLWEGRFKSSLIDSERYLMTCYRYIELNPVRAQMVSQPNDYRWSSHACNAYAHNDPRITHHERYQSLGKTEKQRCMAYLDLFNEPLSNNDLVAITSHANRCRALGSEYFLRELELHVGIEFAHIRQKEG